MSRIGPIIVGTDIQAAAKAHLRAWLPDYLAEIEREKGLEPRTLPMIRGWETTSEIRKWPETQLPACILVSSGTAGQTEKRGDGAVSGWFRLQAIAVAAANKEAATVELAQLYCAAIRSALMQHPSLRGNSEQGIADGIRYVAEGYGPIPDIASKARSIAAAGVVVDLRIPELMNTRAGLAVPSEDPYATSDWPTVADTDLEVERT